MVVGVPGGGSGVCPAIPSATRMDLVPPVIAVQCLSGVVAIVRKCPAAVIADLEITLGASVVRRSECAWVSVPRRLFKKLRDKIPDRITTGVTKAWSLIVVVGVVVVVVVVDQQDGSIERGKGKRRTAMASRVAVVLGLVLASLRPLAVEGKIYRNYSDIGELSKNHASLSLSDILPTHQKTYDKNRAPKLLGQPTVVYFHVTVLSIDSINEESMTYVADIFLAQSWRDPRLRLPENMSEEYRILDVDWLHSIWRPDCFFKNAKKVTFHEMSIPNHYLWLYHDKTLLYMSKLTLVLSCAMKFESYPHDTQICSMMIESSC
uniref:Neurotransmitter-gated ion-channel ligand-binding domain-containing protein n=1 Tax=Anopheles merus TaxID=30066 RepID=A0A182VKB2_ANOME